ncbi:uncharacterized protein TNCV_3700231 [Trichonephila clavipes]|nr:uncharacterized protein TNCV_3700231 [Trichonephila clavipes]
MCAFISLQDPTSTIVRTFSGTKLRTTLRRRLPAILWIRKTTWSLHRLRSTPGLKELICRTWVVPPLHPWYFQRHPGSAISFKGSRSYQTVFSRFSTGHLRCMNFEGGKKASQFAPNVTSVLFLLSTFCNVWGFPVRRLLHPPAVLRLCTNLWTHGSGLVKLDQMGISPTTTTRYKKIALGL